MDHKQSYNAFETVALVAFRAQKGMSVEVIKVPDFKYEVRCDL